jgi:hypothetical protein
MNWLRIVLLAGLSISCVLADVIYDQSFGSSVGRYDVEPSLLQVPSPPPTVFDSPLYSPAPFDPANTQVFKVYVKSNKMARIGSLTSTIYDLDAGTVTAIDHEKCTYVVTGLAAMQRHIDKSRNGNAGVNIQIADTGRTMNIDGETATEYLITARTGSTEESEAVAHAVYWNVQKLQSEELAAFLKRCLNKYGRKYPALCSLTESTGFGTVGRVAAGLDGSEDHGIEDAGTRTWWPEHLCSGDLSGRSFRLEK